MKRWIKAHSRPLGLVICILFLGVSSSTAWDGAVENNDLRFLIGVIGVIIWLFLILWVLNIPARLYKWWDKD